MRQKSEETQEHSESEKCSSLHWGGKSNYALRVLLLGAPSLASDWMQLTAS
jgi:hypothetical protein